MAPVIVCVVLMPAPSAGRGVDRQGRAGLGGETADRLQLRDLRSHRLDDAPAARERAEADGGVGRSDSTQNGIGSLPAMSARDNPPVNSAPAMMPIVFCASLAPCIRLNAAADSSCIRRKKCVDAARRRVPEYPVAGVISSQADDDADQRRDDDEDQRLCPARDDDGREARLCNRCARIAAEKRM